MRERPATNFIPAHTYSRHSGAIDLYLGISTMWPVEILLLAVSISIVVTLLWFFRGLTPSDTLKGCQEFYCLKCVYQCACLSTFCSSVTYCATMKGDSVVKLSAVAAMCEYILSTSLAHSRYTSLSGPLKTTINVNSITC